MFPVLTGKCLGTCWFMGGWRMDRGPGRMIGPPPQLPNQDFSCQGAVYPVSCQEYIDPHVVLASLGVAEWSSLSHPASLLPCHSSVTEHSQDEVQQVTAMLFASPYPVWKVRTVLCRLCWSVSRISFHTAYLIYFYTAVPSVFEPSGQTQTIPATYSVSEVGLVWCYSAGKPHRWELGLRPVLPKQPGCAG